jgi:hypothetical protein
MSYSRAKLKGKDIKHLVSDHFGQENYQTNVYLYGLHYKAGTNKE